MIDPVAIERARLLSLKLGVTLVCCEWCDGWHRSTVLCGSYACERLRAHQGRASARETVA